MGYMHIQRTLTSAEVPDVMRNYGVTSGYRLLNQPWIYYFKSLFQLHNETLNIWTHLTGAVLALYQTYTYFGIYSLHNSEIKWTVLGHGIICFEVLFNSMIAHLLHSKSPYIHYMLFMYDYLGIVCWVLATNFLAVYGVSDEETYHWIEPYYIVFQIILAYFIFINICLAKIWYSHDLTSIRRKAMVVVGFGAQIACAVVPWIRRYFTCYYSEACEMSSLNHITAVCLSFLITSISYLLHLPERINSGKYDIFGQSHQIFHVLGIITQYLQFRCLYIDFLNGANTHCKPRLFITIVCMSVLNLAGILTIVCAKDRVKKHLKCYLSKSK